MYKCTYPVSSLSSQCGTSCKCCRTSEGSRCRRRAPSQAVPGPTPPSMVWPESTWSTPAIGALKDPIKFVYDIYIYILLYIYIYYYYYYIYIYIMYICIHSIWYRNIRILQSMISGIPLILGLGARMSDPCVYVVFWAPKHTCRLIRYPSLKAPDFMAVGSYAQNGVSPKNKV